MNPSRQFGHLNPVTPDKYQGHVGGDPFRHPEQFHPLPGHSALTSSSVGAFINKPMWSQSMSLSRATKGSAADWSEIGTGSAASGGR